VIADAAREPVVVVIPASLASRRLPRKMLLDDTGEPLVVHTWRQARRARSIDRVLVATGDDEIRDAVTRAGGEVVSTPAELRSGTDRVAAVARELDAPWFVNVQGDEPTIDPDDLDRLADELRSGRADVVTIAQPVADAEEWSDPNTVKLVRDAEGRALYFSRASIPFPRGGADSPYEGAWKHVGVYGYSRRRVLEFAASESATLEVREGLEQLRALELGWTIGVVESRGDTRGINSREDYERFVAAWRAATVATERNA
jgi:3-deoxy-manno-octulosonate cytidylyltransferase (CMP-KDO synthetase)